MKCWWIFGHSWSNWVDFREQIGERVFLTRFQYKTCSKCGKKVSRYA